jgi:hypothetical protein
MDERIGGLPLRPNRVIVLAVTGIAAVAAITTVTMI